MNYEESRFRTFGAWPEDAAVDAARIAKAGFYYTGQGMEVQCFSCGGKISEWNYGDQVMTKHRRLDPRCPFIVNPATSGNYPLLSNSHNANNVHPASQSIILPSSSAEGDGAYLSESARLESYTSWPVAHVVSPENLAKAGFFSLGQGDKVKCAYCHGIVGFWEMGDEPKSEHRRHFPSCSFVLSNFETSPLHVPDSSSGAVPTSLTVKLETTDLQELGIQTHKGPRQDRYATIESRLRTFLNWPGELIQTPDMLSEAGFYYVGMGDQVRCFHCDGGLRHWDPQDDPWVEHARWFPSCAFLRLVKGSEFIQTCNPTGQEVSERINPSRPNRSSPFTRVRDVSEQDIQAYMSTPPALAALSIGLHVGRVKQAVRHKMEHTGVGFTSPDALIEAALNLQLDESESTDPEISDEVSRILSSVLIQGESNSAHQVDSKQQKVEDKPSVSQCAPIESHVSLEEENRLLREARLCKICMDNEIGVVFLPCGHLTTCINCAPSLKDCPVCRSVIKATVRTFLS